MTAVLILGWMTIAALVLIARVDYRVPPRLITDPTERADAKLRARSLRTVSTPVVFRPPPLPEPLCADSK